MQEPEKTVSLVQRFTHSVAVAARHAAGWFTPPSRRLRAAAPARRIVRSATRRTEPDPEAARAGASSGLAALAAALAHPEPTVRARALEIVCEFSEERAAELLGGMLHDPEASVRYAAATAAGRVPAYRVVAPLIVTLQDVDVDVRRASAHALERLTGSPVPLEEPGSAVSEGRLNELRKWWKEHRLAELLAGIEGRS
jgi:HEAT repeat protein